MGTLIGDATNAGASRQTLAMLNAGTVNLLNLQKKLTNDQAKYAAMTQYKSSITSTLAGAFDPTKYGSVTDLAAGLHSATGVNKSYAGEVNSLRKRAKGNKQLTAFINQLAQSGQTATLQTLAGASGSGLAQITKGLVAYNGSLTAGGNAAVMSQYGTTITAEAATVKADQRHIKDVATALANLAVAQTSHPPKLVLNGHEISTTVVNSPEMQHMIDHLADLVHYGRKP
jgi:hypothetical protein